MKRIYIDITQLYYWQGEMTGIQRVMIELARRFVDDERFAPSFIIWSKNTATFYEVDFREWLLSQEAQSAHPTPKPRTSKTKAALKRAYYGMPLSRTMYNTYSSINAKFIQRVPGKAVEIEAGSIFFMPHGGVWESDTYISRILDLQQKARVKLIPILFDITPIRTPQFVVEPVRIVFENYMRQVLPKSSLVLSISKNTAQDIRQLFETAATPDAKVNVKVFRLGDEVSNKANKPAITVPKDYILCVGTVEARKNHASLYFAYKQAKTEGEVLPKLVIVGRLGWMAGDIHQMITTDPDTKDSFIFLHDIADSELAWLYENALFSIYPSFYEGWGLPVAESLLHGTPCLASDTSSMPEIGGDLVEYFSPYSPDQIKSKIELYATRPDLLQALKDKVKKGYKVTTWDMSYDQVTRKILEL